MVDGKYCIIETQVVCWYILSSGHYHALLLTVTTVQNPAILYTVYSIYILVVRWEPAG